MEDEEVETGERAGSAGRAGEEMGAAWEAEAAWAAGSASPEAAEVTGSTTASAEGAAVAEEGEVDVVGKGASEATEATEAEAASAESAAACARFSAPPPQPRRRPTHSPTDRRRSRSSSKGREPLRYRPLRKAPAIPALYTRRGLSSRSTHSELPRWSWLPHLPEAQEPGRATALTMGGMGPPLPDRLSGGSCAHRSRLLVES